MAAVTSAPPARTLRGRLWLSAGARAITSPTSSRKETCKMRTADSNNPMTEPAGEATPEREASGEDNGLSRRDMLKIAATAAITIPLAGLSSATNAATSAAAAQWKAPLFFTREEFAMVDE